MSSEGVRVIVVGPPIGVVVPITDDGMGPIEYGCDVYLVDAPDRSAAKWAALRRSTANGDPWGRDARSDSRSHPLRGVKVLPASPDDTPAAWGERFYVPPSVPVGEQPAPADGEVEQ